MEVKTLTKLGELNALGSALTMVGITEESIPDFTNWVKQYTAMKEDKAYIVKGKTMNRVYKLKGNVRYPEDLTIAAIKLEDMENPNAIVIPRFEVGAMWFDDIVMNIKSK